MLVTEGPQAWARLSSRKNPENTLSRTSGTAVLRRSIVRYSRAVAPKSKNLSQHLHSRINSRKAILYVPLSKIPALGDFIDTSRP